MVEYIIRKFKADVIRVSTSDGATAVRCAIIADCSPIIVGMRLDAWIGKDRPSTVSYGQSSSDR